MAFFAAGLLFDVPDFGFGLAAARAGFFAEFLLLVFGSGRAAAAFGGVLGADLATRVKRV